MLILHTVLYRASLEASTQARRGNAESRLVSDNWIALQIAEPCPMSAKYRLLAHRD